MARTAAVQRETNHLPVVVKAIGCARKRVHREGPEVLQRSTTKEEGLLDGDGVVSLTHDLPVIVDAAWIASPAAVNLAQIGHGVANVAPGRACCQKRSDNGATRQTIHDKCSNDKSKVITKLRFGR